MLSFLCAAINKSYLIFINNRVAGDLRRYDAHITMTPHGCQVVSNHRSFNCSFNSLCGPTRKKHQRSHHWPFVGWIHRWPMNSPYKGPIMREKSFVCLIMMRRHDKWYNAVSLSPPFLNQISSSDRSMRVVSVVSSNKQRVLMHGHQGWNARHGLCHIYMRYVYIYLSCL